MVSGAGDFDNLEYRDDFCSSPHSPTQQTLSVDEYGFCSQNKHFLAERSDHCFRAVSGGLHFGLNADDASNYHLSEERSSKKALGKSSSSRYQLDDSSEPYLPSSSHSVFRVLSPTAGLSGRRDRNNRDDSGDSDIDEVDENVNQQRQAILGRRRLCPSSTNVGEIVLSVANDIRREQRDAVASGRIMATDCTEGIGRTLNSVMASNGLADSPFRVMTTQKTGSVTPTFEPYSQDSVEGIPEELERPASSSSSRVRGFTTWLPVRNDQSFN
ncbi:unnamed protein product [Protopolystoma xenopodis]|uniref:Uncharacterized protein n=1 Tax=Protopolystoma xenopodis TaxID=117903 RepID=A0A3S4ZR91_9PLAT|nr:unnamed protein product [Protopolystoma xenopodis]